MKRRALDIVVTLTAVTMLTWSFSCAGATGSGRDWNRKDVASTTSVGMVADDAKPAGLLAEVVVTAEAPPGLLDEVVVIAERPTFYGLLFVELGEVPTTVGLHGQHDIFRN